VRRLPLHLENGQGALGGSVGARAAGDGDLLCVLKEGVPIVEAP
jgi:hypothetical protein